MTESAEFTAAAARSSCVLFKLERHPLIQLSGVDSTRYLQGRLTQNIKALTTTQGARSLLLTPQGRIQGCCTVLYCDDQSYWLIADPSDSSDKLGEPFLKALLQFKVADQFTAQQKNSEFELYSLQGPLSTTVLSKLGCQDLPLSTAAHQHYQLTCCSLRVITFQRGAAAGYDLIVEKSSAAALEAALQNLEINLRPVTGGEEARQMLRIRAGLPEGGTELLEKTMATEIAVTDFVSFNKGCYAGQEVVEMSTARGRPNRRLRTFSVSTSAAIVPGTILASSSAEGKSCGEITSSCYFPSESTCYFMAFIKSSISDEAEIFCNGIACRASVT